MNQALEVTCLFHQDRMVSAMKYGKAIRTCRAALGLQQQELAEKAGLTPGFLSLIEAEKRQPSTRTIERVSHALGVPQHLLLLLASESKDLKLRPVAETQKLSKALLDVLVAAKGA